MQCGYIGRLARLAEERQCGNCNPRQLYFGRGKSLPSFPTKRVHHLPSVRSTKAPANKVLAIILYPEYLANLYLGFGYGILLLSTETKRSETPLLILPSPAAVLPAAALPVTAVLSATTSLLATTLSAAVVLSVPAAPPAAVSPPATIMSGPLEKLGGDDPSEVDDPDDLAFLVGGAYSMAVLMPLMKTPFHTSKLSGEGWTRELLSSSNPRFIRPELRMERSVFEALCRILEESGHLRKSRYVFNSLLAFTSLTIDRYVSVQQQVHVFIYIVSSPAAKRNAQSRFQHSGETISRYFQSTLGGLEAIGSKYIKLPGADTLTPTEITLNTKLYPYFKDCIGAIDGSLVPARVAAGKNSFAYRCRKGFTAKIILAVCSFDLTFRYVLAGWEGAANDSGVLDDALSKGFSIQFPNCYYLTDSGEGFTIQSPNRYCLADAGYGLTPNFLKPYRRIRYHLKEFSLGDQKPQMLGSLAGYTTSYFVLLKAKLTHL